jgi:hypothetical protein
MDTHKDKLNTSFQSVSLEGQSNKEFDPVTLFKKDKNFVYAHQKIKKLIAAVYMISNYFDENEPIKWSLRKLGMELMRHNIDYRDLALQGAGNAENQIKEKVLEMVSLLEVASFAGLVSSMNLSVLKREFHELLVHIGKSTKAGERNGITVDSHFFNIPEVRDESEDAIQIQKNESTREKFSNISDTNKNADNKSKTILHTDNSSSTKENFQTEGNQRHNNDESVEKKGKLKDYGPVAVKKNKRQSIIINLLKRKREIMIKDVSPIINDCSEKTIQRELLALVDQGILKKEGERRWTKYTLA